MMQMTPTYPIQVTPQKEQYTNQNLPTIDLSGNNTVVIIPDGNAFLTCNQGIANGFGAMFFNIRDPSFQQTNQPIKQDAAFHAVLAVVTAILVVCFAVAAAGYRKFLGTGGSIALFVVSYVIYVSLGICFSELRKYIHNMKKNSEYEQTYNKMVQGRGFFRFWIECYHYQTVRTKKGTHRRKVVTHTANEIFAVSACFDQSGQIGSIIDFKSYVFLHYLKRYYFTDDASQNRFVAAFNNFVARHRRDCYQNYSHTFDIEGYEEFASFTAMGETNRTLFTFYLFTALGMGLPYACIFQRFIARYQVGLLKRLTV